MNKRIILIGSIIFIIACFFPPTGNYSMGDLRFKGWKFLFAIEGRNPVIIWKLLLPELIAIFVGTIGIAYALKKKK